MTVEVELTRIHQGDGVEPRLDLRKGEGTQRVGLGRPSRLALNSSCSGQDWAWIFNVAYKG